MRDRSDEKPRSSFEQRRDQLLPRLEVFEYFFLIIVGVFLILLVLVALAAAVIQVWEPLIHRQYLDAVVQGIDTIFLAIILLELLHTTLSRGPLIQQVQEFLMIGITAAVRHSLAVGAERATGPRDVVINLAINALAVLILVLAMWLVRQRLMAEVTNAPAGAIEADGDHLNPSAVPEPQAPGSAGGRM